MDGDLDDGNSDGGLGQSALPVADAVVEALVRAVASFSRPGASWSASERQEIVRVARAAGDQSEVETTLPEAVVEATSAVADAPDYITHQWVVDLERRGVGAHAYVEIVGVVSRLAAVDALARGVGAELVVLPPPEDRPNGTIRTAAQLEGAWVPTVGPSGAANALSAVDEEHRLQEDLHTAFYLGYGEMGDFDIVKDGLHRTQMELVAARTSYRNNCFY